MNLRPFPLRALLVLLGVAGCSDLAVEPPDPAPHRLRFAERSLYVTEGGRVTPGVEVLDAAGQVMPVPSWVRPVWTTTHPTVASAEGKELVALVPGRTNAQVRLAGLQASILLLVNPREVGLTVQSVQLNQAVQRPDGVVPLIAGRDAALRVFLRGDRLSFFHPSVRVHFYHEGRLARTVEAVSHALEVPVAVRDEDVGLTWTAHVPGELIRRGASLRVEVDAERRLPLTPGSNRSYPAEGTLPLDVLEVAPLEVDFIPIRDLATDAVGSISEASAPQYLESARAVFPLQAISHRVRATYTSSADLRFEASWNQLLSELAAKRRAEGGTAYYYGVLPRSVSSKWAGLGYIGYPAAIGVDGLPGSASTFAHEMGHNLSLRHAPCGDPSGVDPSFPYTNARLGYVGYDIYARSFKLPAENADLMSYCGNRWISDYHYLKVMQWRLAHAARGVGAPASALLVWGRVGEGTAVLEPAFVLDMPPAPPEGEGPYRIEGYDAAGGRLFSFRFQGESVDHAGGERAFAYAIPAEVARPERLHRLLLVTPGGTRSLRARDADGLRPSLSLRAGDGGTAVGWDEGQAPMALIRDRTSGEILSFARGGHAMLAPGRGYEVLLSDGVRTLRPVPTR